MAEVSQNTKYVKLDDGVSFALVRTNPKLTTNTKLMYNGIGYLIYVPSSLFDELPIKGDMVCLYTYLYVREDQMTL